ncbi:MAG: preprotein translocase subunit SecG [Spirochaetia bacterium]|nr:preprotein translocase subunit SecG [Spirochaetia bacterium]
MQILGTILNVFFVIVSLLLILLILMQSGRSSGIGLMGGSASQSAFGAGSADVLTKMTAILVALFMLTGLGLAFIKSGENSIQKIQGNFTEKPLLEDDTSVKPNELSPNSANLPGAEAKPGNEAVQKPVEPLKPATTP